VLTFSLLIFSGRVMITSYPFTAPHKAKPIPVFPEVGSIIVQPGAILPDFSASSIILKAIRSLTEPPALKNSHLATIVNEYESFPPLLTQFANKPFGGRKTTQFHNWSIANTIQNGRMNFRRATTRRKLQGFFKRAG
jgi:hypothetical protein